MERARNIIHSVKGRSLSREERCLQAIHLAELLLLEANRLQTHEEKRRERELTALLEDAKGKNLLLPLLDQCFRTHSTRRIVDQTLYLIGRYGIPSFLDKWSRLQIRLFQRFGRYFPSFSAHRLRNFLQKKTAPFILPAEPNQLYRRLSAFREANLNLLGEAILGEEEAEKRLRYYCEQLQHDAIQSISIKISSIYSQIDLLSFEESVDRIAERLQHLYDNPNKRVHLDMEGYVDGELTLKAFQKALADPRFFTTQAGIALQSYLPNSWLWQKELTEWAKRRVAEGGAPIHLRLVKGANLAMEQVEASLHSWPQAPYTTKRDVDAQLFRMLEYACEPENAHAVHIGLGSHNLFFIAYALLLRAERGVDSSVQFEMLLGMADKERRALASLGEEVLVYCPITFKETFHNAIAYLIRRLDENAGPQNFLRHLSSLEQGSDSWEEQTKQFLLAANHVDTLQEGSRRRQNRWESVHVSFEHFSNEPDTDWTLLPNRLWAEKILEKQALKKIDPIPCTIGGQEWLSVEQQREGRDPSSPHLPLYTYAAANEEQIDQALDHALKAFPKWEGCGVEGRSAVLLDVARIFRKRRGDLIGAMVADGGKTIGEADREVSEAIDFIEYYRRNAEEYVKARDFAFSPKGPVLVTPPWNFPCSIPTGGIAAALIAGNAVLFKPAPETVLIGRSVAECFWDGGIGKDLLQFIPCDDEPTGSMLIQDPRVAAVILTGSTETARHFLRLRPDIDLIGETGGKNTMILSNLCDRDLAIRDLVQSAFGHAGQKCSACSLGILFAELYDDTHFLAGLRDAVASLRVGSAWDFATRIPPLIRSPSSILLRGLTQLEEGEEWLLQPRPDPENPHLWHPGIKLGVRYGSFTHQTELFGPVLGLMRANDLSHALHLANGTQYGLTGGLHTLDDREKRKWIQNIQVGNAYINRAITGSMVRRQPFGGTKESSFGRSFKTGGPQFLLQMVRINETGFPEGEGELPRYVGELDKLLTIDRLGEEGHRIWKASIHSYAFYWQNDFSIPQDPSRCMGQDNYLFYVPRRQHLLRVQEGDNELDIFRVVAGALTCHARIVISGMAQGLPHHRPKLPGIIWAEEDEAAFLERMRRLLSKKVRFLQDPPETLRETLIDQDVHITVVPVLMNGRLELLNHLREMAVSMDYHRYGNLGNREGESRAPLPDEQGVYRSEAPTP